MKRYGWIAALLAVLLSACAAAEPTAPSEPAAPAASMVAPEPQAPEAPQPAAPAETPAAAPQDGTVDALAIAIKEAGVQAADIRAPKVTADVEDGVSVLEVEFYVPAQQTEYEYEIDAKTGAVRESSADRKGAANAPDGVKPEADILALLLEKVPGAAEQDVALYLDMDDGVARFEGVVRYDGTEYEFEIDAKTGEILEWETEQIR